MKKSVRIRKAGPGEKAGYYNKTAKFLNKALPKANQGMQVQERMKVIMRDAYYAIRDGADPSAIYEQLVTQYGIEQQMAYAILDTVMKRLAKEGYKNPDYGKNEEDEDDIGTKKTPAPEQTIKPTQTVASTNDDEEAALAESDMPSAYDGMDHLNSGTSEYATESAFGKYGGSFDDGGEYTDDYPEYYNDTEQTVLDQYANPGQLSTSEQIPFSLERLVEFTPGVQGLPKTPDLSYYLNNYAPIADDNAIPQDLLPENKYGGLNKFVSGGPGKGKGPGGPGKRGRKKSTKTETTTPTPPPPPITPESIRTEIIPQESIVQPNIFQRYQNFFGLNNPLSTRGFMGQRIENLGTVLNKARPRNWTQSGIGFGKFKTPGRESVAPFTTSTLLIEDINNIVRDPNYKPKTLIKNEDGTYGTGLGFNIDADLANFLIEKAQQAEKIIKDAGGKRVQKDGKTITLDIDDLMSIRDNERETTGTLLETPENQFTQKQLAQWQNYSDLREGFGLPGSTMPELDFLNLHRQNKGQIKISKDSKGLFKIELVSEVPTRLKGYKNTGLKIKDEIIVNPTTKEILDPTTKQPFSIADKNYYRGNRLRWYNRPYTLPFTPKYPDAFSSSDRGGNDLSTYPLDISDSPLMKEVPSYGNILWNTVGKGMLGLLPFTAGRFTNKSRFYPNAEQVKAGFYSRPRETGPQTAGGMTFGDQTLLDQYKDYNLMKNRNYQTGLGFLKTAGTLGLLGTYMYNQFTNEPDEDFFYDRQDNILYNPNKLNFTGQGRVGYDPNFGVTTPRLNNILNNYGKDSMFIQGTDTTYDKGWGELGPNYKKGGAHKKQFVKNVMSKFAPGGESQDPSLGRGNRMDNLNQEVSNKKKWIPAIKKEADKKATDDLYAAVQKSGDPKLMNIFMGNNQQQQPQDNQMMQQPQFGEMGGYVNMDVENPLTRFIYGGDEDPDFYEPYSLPEAGGGITMPPGGSGGQYIADKMSPALDQNTFEPNPDNTDIVENPNCPPGYAYSRTYNQCVPIMQKRINYNMVRQTPGFINSIIPMNRLFNKYIVPDYRGMDNPYSRKNLRQYRKDNARDDRYRALPMLFAQRANREPREYNRYGINNFLTRSLPFGAFLQPKYRNGGINLTTTGNWMSGYNSNIDAPQGTSTEFDANGNPIKSVAPQPATPEQFYVNSNEKPAPQSPLAPNPFAAYKVKNQMQGENLDNTLNFFGNTYAGILNRNKMNPQNFANIMDTTNLLNNVPTTTPTYRGQQQDVGQNMGTFGIEQGNDRNSLSTFGNYPSSQYGGYMEYGGFANPYEEEEVYMTDDEIQDYLARGGEIEYL